jgi:Serine acetyltransferase
MRPFQLVARIILHIEVPRPLFIKGLFLAHPYNIIIHSDAVIGWNVTIYHGVTIAKVWAGKKKGSPTIGDNVIIYPQSIILGNVTIGENSIVGAGSVVVHDVPPNSIVAGNPARTINTVTDERPIAVRRYY